jgi:hypothetical protein
MARGCTGAGDPGEENDMGCVIGTKRTRTLIEHGLVLALKDAITAVGAARGLPGRAALEVDRDEISDLLKEIRDRHHVMIELPAEDGA